MAESKYLKSVKAVGGKSPSRLAATLAFDGGVDKVRAVSGERRLALAKMNITSLRDLLTHFPYRYLDMSRTCSVSNARIGESCTITGVVYETKLKQPKPRLDLVEITLTDDTGTMIVTCFRQPWLAEKLQPGVRIAVSGKLEFNYGFKRMTNPFIEQVDAQADASGVIVPVHHATEKIPTAWMRRLIAYGLELCRGLDDPLPMNLKARYRLVSRNAALNAIHFPVSMDEAFEARRRLVYEELLFLELHLKSRSLGNPAHNDYQIHVIDGSCTRALEATLPFSLTEEQRIARAQITQVMAAPRRANHMLLGDVGTGKTIVAAFALTAAADSGCQALMMAPTEVLAAQHAERLTPLLNQAGVACALLTSSTTSADRAAIIEGLSSGAIQVLFGTQALLEPDVVPVNCSLVIIDEQQRFGVQQRQALVEKGNNADVLSLTATPIPRSLALALYGDMTLSYIKSRPLNRAGVSTCVLNLSNRGDAYDAALEELQHGHQVYVVCPLVGDSRAHANSKKNESTEDLDEYVYSSIVIETEEDLDSSDMRQALEHAQYLSKTVFAGYEVEVLHGRMKSEKKSQVMQQFRENEVQVLVSTTVIEVGVDVPNATVMIVEDADRFGLAQLHQLRGRVGRSELPGNMFLISGSKAPAALDRLAAMEDTDDGFTLAEYDLSLRREGDILGNRQHGASVLKLVNVIRDAVIIEAAHADAEEILAKDPTLTLPEHRALKCEIARLFPEETNGGER